MPKKIIQDVIAQDSSFKPKIKEEAGENIHFPETPPRGAFSTSAYNPKESVSLLKDEESRINASPLFERMKERQERRGNFSQEFSPKAAKIRAKYWYGALAVAVLFGMLWVYGMFLGGAEVTVFPKHAQVTLLDTPVIMEANGTDFQVMTVTAEDVRELPATGEKYTEKKASGKIVIYNDFDENPQRLVKNTRFKSKEGKIYRIAESVTVQGKQGESPGTLEVTVYADLPGVEYNVGQMSFTVPGFEGAPRFEKFYAKSKTAMSGGFQGNMKTVSESDLAAAKQELEAALTENLWTKALAEKPEGTVIWKTVAVYDFSHESADSESGNVSQKASGTITVGVFDARAFSRLIAAGSLGISPEERVLADGIENMDVEFKDVNTLRSGELASAEVLVTGNSDIVWEVDTTKLAEALAGTKKKEYSNVFGKFPSVERARVTITPFWSSRFPDDPKDIEVEIVKEEGKGGE